jgi:hypothetical protein
MYEGNLEVEELLDWVRAIDKYFDYEDIKEYKMVKHGVTRLKGHATLWWDELQAECMSNGKKKIKRWDRMVDKLKEKFIPKDYQINMSRRLQNLRHKSLSMKEYTEEVYRLNIRAGQKENEDEKTSRYINGLRYEIQEEINMISVNKVKDSYQAALKDEEKLAKKQSQRNRGGNSSRGKGTNKEKFQKPKHEAGKQHSHPEKGGSSKEGQPGGGISFSRRRGRDRGGEVRCYTCGKPGQKSWECPERKKEGGGEAHISEAQNHVEVEATEGGKNLMMRKVLLKPEKEVDEPVQRTSLFRTACKMKDKVCKVIIDSGSTDNLVST